MDFEGKGRGVPARIPAYTPYLVPKLRTHPRMPDKTDHSASPEGWGGGVDSKNARRRISHKSSRYKLGLCVAGAFFFRLRGAKLSIVSGAYVISSISYRRRPSFPSQRAPIWGSLISGAHNVRLDAMDRQMAVSSGEFVRLLSSGKLGVKEQAHLERALSLWCDIPQGIGECR